MNRIVDSMLVDAIETNLSEKGYAPVLKRLCADFTGNIRIYGSMIYCSLIKVLHGSDLRIKDLDIIIDEGGNSLADHPLGKLSERTASGAYRWSGYGKQIDMSTFTTLGMHSWEDIPNTWCLDVERFFYDPCSKRLLDAGGMRPLQERTVDIITMNQLATFRAAYLVREGRFTPSPRVLEAMATPTFETDYAFFKMVKES